MQKVNTLNTHISVQPAGLFKPASKFPLFCLLAITSLGKFFSMAAPGLSWKEEPIFSWRIGVTRQ